MFVDFTNTVVSRLFCFLGIEVSEFFFLNDSISEVKFNMALFWNASLITGN